MYHFALARRNIRRMWNIHTAAILRKTYSTQSSTMKALAQGTSGVVASRPTISLSKRLSRTKGKHILWLDLTELKYGQGEVVHYSVDLRNSMNWNRLDEEVLKLDMMNKLKEYVEADSRKCPSERIDSVQWNVDDLNEPREEMWEILNGLSPPKHLKIVPGWDEVCHMEPLKTFQHQWNNLDTLTLVGICDSDLMGRLPGSFSQISSLTLDWCCGLNFIPPAATRLKDVRIVGNNPCDMFIYAVDHNPCFPQTLEVLEMESTSDFCHMYDPPEFRPRLRKCTRLREFSFTVGPLDDLDTDLASYIPPSVEKLTLHFTRSIPFLHDFDDWIRHASDQTWLPSLKFFQLSIDPKSRISYQPRTLENPPEEFTPEAFDLEFEKKRNVLYDVLKSTRPSINLLV